MLHGFGYRGSSSNESSNLCGSAHLLNFSGTDTISAISLPINYYNTPNIQGYSVQATEHNVMTSLGEENEYQQAINVINHAKDGILSIVIDSYNYRNFLQNTCHRGHELNTKINEFLNKNKSNKIVFRSDSGEPVSTTIDCLEIIGEGFGTKETNMGYKVFNANIGLLWGDGLNYHKIRDILFGMKTNGWLQKT